MVDFNTKDFNLTAIRHESKLTNLMTRRKYRIYGLRQQENPPILIEYNANGDECDKDFINRLVALVEFFKKNGIEAETFDDAETTTIGVGLRKDLRSILNNSEQPLFAASIISTIVYCLEGRISLPKMAKYKLVNVPKLPLRVIEEILD